MNTGLAYSDTYSDTISGIAEINTLRTSYKMIPVIPATSDMLNESDEGFSYYLKSLGLFRETEFVVLPADKHYFYDENDLKKIRTLVNLRKLNLMKDPGTFLKTLFGVLPPGTNFVGCFSDVTRGSRKNGNSAALFSGMIKKFNNMLDSKSDHDLDRNSVLELLKKYGFIVLDMTVINNLTYFYSKNFRRIVNLSA